LSSGLIALPSWAKGWQVETLKLSPSVFASTEQEILTAVVDTIIPQGNSIGALSVDVDKFLQKLLSDCYDAATQDNVKKQLNNLEAMSLADYTKSFAATDQLQRQELLLKMAAGEKDKVDFFNLIKSETIRGFNTSKEVLGDRLKYKATPGHYKGCVDVNV
jgi:gluconate 2-dehydrogenase subunit 3-like protein